MFNLLTNMANKIGPKSMNFIRRLNRGNIYLLSHKFEIWGFIGGWKLATNAKLQHNIPKFMPA